MAQTGFTPISNYYSATATNVPTAGNLVAGELAINTADGKLFYKDSAGVVQTMASKATTAGTYSSITTSNLTIGTTQLGAGNASAMKNRIINGAMVIDQRNAGAAVTSSGSYPVDRFYVNNATDGTFSAQQSTDVPTGQGFVNSLKVTYPTGDASIGATQYSNIQTTIEGFNIADLGFGTASAKTVTLSFWVKATVAGQYSYAIFNSTESRINPQPFTINASNTWEYKSITYAGDTTGTWLTTNGKGLNVTLYTALGSSYLGSAGWNTSGIYGVTGQANAMASNGNIFAITGVQLEVGSSATGFEYRLYNQELSACQRYYYQVAAGGSAYTQFGAGRAFSTTGGNGIVQFPMPMRTAPTFAYLGAVGNYDFSPTAIASGAVPSTNTHMTVGYTFTAIVSGSMFWLGQNNTSSPCGFTFNAEL
jgi:hypothetical protein